MIADLDNGMTPTGAPLATKKPKPTTVPGATMAPPGSTITSMAPTAPKLPTPGVTPVSAQTPVTPAMPAAVPASAPAPTGPLTSSAGDGFGAPAAVPAGGVAGAPGPKLTPTDPTNPLTAQTISPGAGMDRVALAKQTFDTWMQGTEPAYKAAIRDATRASAAGGTLGLGTGGLRGSLGNLAQTRTNAMDVKGQELLNSAIGGSVDDARFATGLAERQQGFQNEQQKQAFAQEMARLGFDESTLNNAFGRALQTFMAGQAGGTGSGTALAGAGAAGAQGQDALTALANLIRNRNAAPGTPAPQAPSPAGQIFPWLGGGANG